MKSGGKRMIETLMKQDRRKTRLAKNYGGGESVNLLLGLVGGLILEAQYPWGSPAVWQIQPTVVFVWIMHAIYRSELACGSDLFILKLNCFLKLSLLKKYHKDSQNAVSCICFGSGHYLLLTSFCYCISPASESYMQTCACLSPFLVNTVSV